MKTYQRRLLGVGLGAAVLASSACADQVGEDKVGIHYTQGSFEGEHCEGIVEPGGSKMVVDDLIVKVPANLRSYIVTNEDIGDKAGGDALRFPTKGTADEPRGPTVEVELEARFHVNTRDKDIACQFYLDVCKKHGCDTGNDGWDRMLDENFYVPMRTVLNEIGPEYNAEQLQVNQEVKDEFGDRFADEFANNLEDLIGRDDFFCGPGYDRDVDDEEDPAYCPPLSLNLSSVTYTSEELRNIPNRRRLAEESVDLAEQERQAADAEQSVREREITPEYIEEKRLDVAQACAENPNPGACVLVITDGAGSAPNVSVTPPAG